MRFKPFQVLPVKADIIGIIKTIDMKIKQLLFVSTLTLFIGMAGNATAQEASQNHRQKHLERKETVNANKSERISERNPNGVGRKDNRVERRGKRIDRKKERTDRRVKRRRGEEEIKAN